ncbi:hypothetical protein ACHAW5_006893 [Stephanodiscus triporus]|uniref:VTT domain-containing protein n=1 Tax=Stephanodiscus triporus TaxID=2934178 RepID=A0ABD3PBE2_9STRA
MAAPAFAAARSISLVIVVLLRVENAHSFALAPESSTRRMKTIRRAGIPPYHNPRVSSLTTTESFATRLAKSSSGSHTVDEKKDDRRDGTPTSASGGSKSSGHDPNDVVDDVWINQMLAFFDGDKAAIETDPKSSAKMSKAQDVADGRTVDDSSESTKSILIGGTAIILIAAGALAVAMGNDMGIDLDLELLAKDPSNSFDTILRSLETLDVQRAMVYFSSFYVLAEILAIPAVPILTASSGYLFGTLPGTAVCLLSAATAATISFVIGRTLLRGYVERVLADNPKFRSMDRAIEKGGFRLMLLVRLSPLFPFALSNYLYGASSLRFAPYFLGTVFGFLPGTFAYVYAGRVGKALTIDSATSEPWYVYVGGMAALVVLLKIAGDVASSVIESLEDEDMDDLELD